LGGASSDRRELQNRPHIKFFAFSSIAPKKFPDFRKIGTKRTPFGPVYRWVRFSQPEHIRAAYPDRFFTMNVDSPSAISAFSSEAGGDMNFPGSKQSSPERSTRNCGIFWDASADRCFEMNVDFPSAISSFSSEPGGLRRAQSSRDTNFPGSKQSSPQRKPEIVGYFGIL
jgi:hypothetical protein